MLRNLIKQVKAHTLLWLTEYFIIFGFVPSITEFVLLTSHFFNFFFTDGETKPSRDGKANSSTGGKENHSLTKESASVIVSVAFTAISIKYVTRAQLASASKTLKLSLKPSLSKEEYVVPVARALIKEGFVKLSSGEVTRENVVKLKSF